MSNAKKAVSVALVPENVDILPLVRSRKRSSGKSRTFFASSMPARGTGPGRAKTSSTSMASAMNAHPDWLLYTLDTSRASVPVITIEVDVVFLRQFASTVISTRPLGSHRRGRRGAGRRLSWCRIGKSGGRAGSCFCGSAGGQLWSFLRCHI